MTFFNYPVKYTTEFIQTMVDNEVFASDCNDDRQLKVAINATKTGSIFISGSQLIALRFQQQIWVFKHTVTNKN